MTSATVTKMVKDRGFGFAEDSEGQLYFFHYSAIDPKYSTSFDELKVGDKIEFIAEPSDKGPRAKPRTLKKTNNSYQVINKVEGEQRLNTG